jgi:uncharacterized protein YndB with AHSA1/START domain
VIEHELELPVSPAEALGWFFAPERLARWLCKRADVEPRVGGRYELFWDLERPEVNSTLGCKVLEYKPERALKVTWAGNEEQLEFMGPGSTTVSVSAEPTAAGCRLRLEHCGFGDGDRWLKAERWFDTAWKNALVRLAELLRSED